MPWYADWYRTKVERPWADALDDEFRLYYNDHAQHGPATEARRPMPARRLHRHAAAGGARRDGVGREGREASGQHPLLGGRRAQVHVPPMRAAARGHAARGPPAGQRPRARRHRGRRDRHVHRDDQDAARTRARWCPRNGTSWASATIRRRAGRRHRAHGGSKTTHTITRTPGTYFPVLRATSQREGDARRPSRGSRTSPACGWWFSSGVGSRYRRSHAAAVAAFYAPSRCSSMTPDGVPPPEVTTAVRAPATWRSPASPRSWAIAS